MAWEFKIRRERALPASPEQVWEAVATGSGNLRWLFPMEIEPWEGGVVSRGPCTVTIWDPPRRFGCRYESEDGFSNNLTYDIDSRNGTSSVLRTVIHWVHRGVVDDGWDLRADAADKHTDFYHHTLEQYLRYFNGRPATYLQAQRSAAPAEAQEFSVFRRELGITDDVTEGDAVRLALQGLDPLDAVVDYLIHPFIGLRTADGLYRFFAGDPWRWPSRLSHHLFAEDIDQEKIQLAWQMWLDEVSNKYAPFKVEEMM